VRAQAVIVGLFVATVIGIMVFAVVLGIMW
jgi:hypothetical protein